MNGNVKLGQAIIDLIKDWEPLPTDDEFIVTIGLGVLLGVLRNDEEVYRAGLLKLLGASLRTDILGPGDHWAVAGWTPAMKDLVFVAGRLEELRLRGYFKGERRITDAGEEQYDKLMDEGYWPSDREHVIDIIRHHLQGSPDEQVMETAGLVLAK